MSHRTKLQRSLVGLHELVSSSVDCLLEGKANVERGEWDFAATNLRKLFGNATAIAKHRRIVLRDLRLARSEHLT